MNRAGKKKAIIAGFGLFLIAMQRYGRGTVTLGPVTVTQEKVDFGKATEADVQRLTLALTRGRQLMGYDPNTFASRQPNAADQTYIEQTLALAKKLSLLSQGSIPYPTVEAERLAFAKKLPGDTLQKANAELYRLLGVDVQGDNEATVPLTTATDTRVRSLIAQWRPYSQTAVDTLFVLLDQARELAGVA